MSRRVVLAYSGGLDTSVAVAWTRTLSPFMSSSLWISFLLYMLRSPSVISAITCPPWTVSSIMSFTAEIALDRAVPDGSAGVGKHPTAIEQGPPAQVRDDGAGMDDFHRDGDLGYGLRIIDELSERCVISSAPGTGTEVRMTFAIDDPSREGSE